MTSITFEKWRFQLLGEGLVRIEWSGRGLFEDKPTAIVQQRPSPLPEFHCQKKKNACLIRGGAFDISLESGTDPFSDAKGLQIRWNRGERNGAWSPGDAASNLGGIVRGLDLCGVGQRVFRLKEGLLSRAGWFLLNDSRTPLLDEQGNLAPRTDDHGIDWYLFVYGDDYPGGLRDLAGLLGSPPMLPRTLLGFWWSRWHPYTERELKSLAARFKDAGIPLSVLVLDMDWHLEGWCRWDWDRKLFPNPEGFIRWCHKKGILLTLNVHPQEIPRCDSHFLPFLEKAGLSRKKKMDKVSVDLADPEQKRAVEEVLLRPFHEKGLDFWWIDGDAAQLDGRLPYQFWTNKVYYDAASRIRKNRRSLVFSRSGGWGSQRYPIGFSGDTMSDWHVLRYLIPFTASGGNFGFGYWSNDTGGFLGEHLPDDLYIRWFQFAALSPILRMHSSHGHREPWSYSDAAKIIAARFYGLRRRLFPYLYTLMQECSESGLPPCRPLYLSLSGDPVSYEHPEEYLLGPDLLCAPVFEAQATGGGVRTVYFPPGLWWDLFTQDLYSGPAVRRIRTPLSRMPLFARAGSVIPMHSEKPDGEKLEYHVYSGESGTGRVYDDDGETRNHERGEFASLDSVFSRKPDKAVFQCGPWKGSYSSLASRDQNLVLHIPGGRRDVSLSPLKRGKPVKKSIPLPKGQEGRLREGIKRTDLIRRVRLARWFEEQAGSPEEILSNYDRLPGEKSNPSGKIRRFLKNRLDHIASRPETLPVETGQALLQELLGIHAEVRLSDSGRPDELLVSGRIWTSPEALEGLEADFQWDLPRDWVKSGARGYRREPLFPDSCLSTTARVRPPLEYNPLGGARFGAKLTIRFEGRKITLHPEAPLDLAGIREAWFIGPFEGGEGKLQKVLGPERGFNPSSSFRGKYGRVRWRHLRIPLDGRDVWSNFPCFDLHRILDTGERDEIACICFRVISERKRRYNFVARMHEEGMLRINGGDPLSLLPMKPVNAITLDAGENEILLKVQRLWGDWDIRLAITSFASNGPPEGLRGPRPRAFC